MKILWRVIGVVLLIAGTVWFLQGINVLPGSFMTGQMRWAVYGILSMAAGIGLWLFSGRR